MITNLYFLLFMSQVLRTLQEKGIIEQIIGSMDSQSNLAKFEGGGSKRSVHTSSGINSPLKRNVQLMHMRLLGGKGFLELDDHADRTGHIRNDKFVVFCHFGNQRFRSSEVTCCEAPSFEDDFILELDVSIKPCVQQ